MVQYIGIPQLASSNRDYFLSFTSKATQSKRWNNRPVHFKICKATTQAEMATFSLSIHSFTPATPPEQPADAPPSAFRSSLFRSSLIPSVASATTPLKFTMSLPGARHNDPLYPATHLQLCYHYEGTGDVFVPKFITSKDLNNVESGTHEEQNVFEVQVQPEDVLRAKVNHGTTNLATLIIHAWRNEKLLGKWTAGEMENLGLVGLKSHEVALLRQATWAANKAKP
jgi:hypothetical protein